MTLIDSGTRQPSLGLKYPLSLDMAEFCIDEALSSTTSFYVNFASAQSVENVVVGLFGKITLGNPIEKNGSQCKTTCSTY